MSTPDLIDERFDELVSELRSSVLVAPDRLREQVRTVASGEPQPRRVRMPRFSVRRAGLVLVPACVMAVAASALVYGVVGSGGSQQAAVQTSDVAAVHGAAPSEPLRASGGGQTLVAPKAAAPSTDLAPATLPATQGRAVDYDAYLELRVSDLSGTTKRALKVTRDLGGYVRSVDYSSASTSGGASLVVRIPVARVQAAIVRFSALGRIVSQHVSIQDVQPSVDRLFSQAQELRSAIARLDARLAATKDAAQRSALEAQLTRTRGQLVAVERERARLVRTVSYATVSLQLDRAQKHAAVPVKPSRLDRALHRAGRILEREGIVALYVLVIAGPLAVLLALALAGSRVLRRRSEQRLLAG